MRSKFLQAQAREKREKILEQERKDEILKDICGIISLNKADLEIEIYKILDFLNSLEDLVVKYNEKDQKLIYWHSSVLIKKLDDVVFIRMLSEKLKEINEKAVYEFFGGVNFFEIIEKISGNDMCKLKSLTLIWKAQRVLKDIKYQFERIWNTDNDRYQIAVFKGMIAME